jgi:hypothetical protein
MGDGRASVPAPSPSRRIKLIVRRRLSPRWERQFKRSTNRWVNWLYAKLGKPTRPVHAAAAGAAPLQTGDLVRVRSVAEVDATLNHWRQLRGCTFMPEMRQYCGTTQRVLKRLERFVDERDLRVKKSSGVVLLQNVICQGTMDFGRCDRSCFLFWREEWLEKLPPNAPDGVDRHA